MLDKDLYLYNTATRSKVKFTPQEPGKVSMYCCGPTVYNYAHIGNLRSYLFEDILRRTLEYAGYSLNHVVNITDVGHLTSDADTGEDKMEKGAQREGRSVWDIAAYYTKEFQNDWKKLGLLQPSLWPKATDHIQEQIDLVKNLESKSFTYILEDGVYFDTSAFPRYADFAKLDVDNLEAGKRVQVTEGKKNNTDFALWKFSPKKGKRAMEWPSPWGIGFPGWHVECSAMAMKHLGHTMDIHCGGIDHVRVHHTNEIAQSESATGKPYARYWVHGGWLMESSEEGKSGKMSKSNEDFMRLKVLEDKGIDPMDYRYFCLTAHYRNYLNFSWNSIQSARESLQSLHKKTDPLIAQAGSIKSEKAIEWQNKFIDAAFDDLNMPRAMGILNQMIKEMDIDNAEKGALVLDFDRILGLNLGESLEKKSKTLGQEFVNLIKEREEARANKNFARADEIRDLLQQNGILIKDGAAGTTWEQLN